MEDSPDPRGAHRRGYTRFPMSVVVEVSGFGGSATFATDDLGAGGCRISYSPGLPAGALVKVRLRSDRTPRTAAGLARVAWVRGGQVGIAFSPPLIEDVVPFVRALVGEDEPLQTPSGS
jgi:hypothetical protein